jgi:Protein of unknown function (DUF629)
LKMPHPKDDPKSPEWRPYIFARDQWHCRICGDRFLYSEMVRKHIADEHDENMPPSMYEELNSARVGLAGVRRRRWRGHREGAMSLRPLPGLVWRHSVPRVKA